MLKITQIDSEILELYISYVKTFLIIALILLICIALIVFFSYEYIKIEANRNENLLKITRFNLREGSNTKDFLLSNVQSISANTSTQRSGKYLSSFEQPTLILKNKETFTLLKKRRKILYTSNIALHFNTFLNQTNQTYFSRNIVYLGNLTSIILAILMPTLLALIVTACLVGDVKMTFDKRDSSYKIRYYSPMYSNKQGHLEDIKAVLLLTKIADTFEQKQAGIYLLLQNKETILIQAIGSLDEKQAKKNILPTREKAHKVANFLKIQMREED